LGVSSQQADAKSALRAWSTTMRVGAQGVGELRKAQKSERSRVAA
jgi:hypothetical protein